MKKSAFIRQYEYTSASPSSRCLDVKTKDGKNCGECFQLIKFMVDFVAGTLRMEYGWTTMANEGDERKKQEKALSKRYIFMHTPVSARVMLISREDDEELAVFPLKGSIRAGNISSYCSGILTIESSAGAGDGMNERYDVGLSLYDLDMGDCEMSFSLPCYIADANARFN